MSEQYPGKDFYERERIIPSMTQFEATWNDAKVHAEIHGLRIVEHGWEQHVIIDELGGLIYRYPRHQAAADKLADEVQVLKDLQEYDWPTAIPHLFDYNGTFATYGYIPGEVLTPERVANLTKEEAEHIGHGIGRFLAQFHRLDPAIVEQKKSRQPTTLLEYYDERIRAGINSPYYDKALAALTELQDNVRKCQPVVLHGDLHGPNVVVDGITNQLHGIIDISEMETGDPHQEFRKIFMTFPAALESTVKAYEHNGGQTIDLTQVVRWAYVNEWANVCYFSEQPDNLTYQRAVKHLTLWQQL